MKLKCPTCKKETEFADNPYRPFCSKRCRTTDLGNWAEEKYAVPTKEVPSEELLQELDDESVVDDE